VGARGGGRYCFGCRIVSEQTVEMDLAAPEERHLCRIGVSRGDDPVGALGESDHSFGFGGTGKFSHQRRFANYGVRFGVGDTVVCAVDLDSKPMASIGFARNGEWLGIAKHFDAGEKGLGLVDAPVRPMQWESALFPHVLLKNIVVEMLFSREDGLEPVDGYEPWASAFADGNAVFGPLFEQGECEVMMMVGLPASGKSTWAEKWVKEHPEKRFILLGTNLALEQMKVGFPSRGNNGVLLVAASSVFDSLDHCRCQDCCVRTTMVSVLIG
jgi:heterogeneous nuclear ribonucleoprotein U-like protein 1